MTRRILARLLPAPLLSLLLLALWLLLERSLSPGQCLIGLALGLGIPAWLAPLRPARARVRHPLVIARLILIVCMDALRSNLAVCGSLMAALAGRPLPPSGFVAIPLELRDPGALAALAVITTITPGTVWCELASDASRLRLHVWRLPPGEGAEAAFIGHFKKRYEQPLHIIFEA